MRERTKLIESRMATSLLAFSVAAVITTSTLADQYAFLVGVRDYSLSGELTSLKYTEDDVHTLARTLYEQGVPQENIVLMTQRMALKTARLSPRSGQIRRELDLLLSELEAGDTLIVGFSGHGLQFGGEDDNYFCPLDAKPDDKSTLISLTKVYAQLDLCKARSKILLVDACRDDPLTQVAKSAKRIELEPVFERKPPVLSGGTVAIFSCSPSQQSFESPIWAAAFSFTSLIAQSQARRIRTATTSSICQSFSSLRSRAFRNGHA